MCVFSKRRYEKCNFVQGKCEQKRGSMENNFAVRSTHKFLTGQVIWVVSSQAYNSFSKRFIFALSKPCPLSLCI